LAAGRLLAREAVGQSLGERQDMGWCASGELAKLIYQADAPGVSVLLTDVSSSLHLITSISMTYRHLSGAPEILKVAIFYLLCSTLHGQPEQRTQPNIMVTSVSWGL